MPIEVVSYMMSKGNIIQRLQCQLILQCAPFLKGIKAACIMNIKEEYCSGLKEALKDTGISYKALTTRKGKCLIFFYRREDFCAYLKSREIKEFLAAYGYLITDTQAALTRLSKRVCQYSSADITFPHEIGVFLGYPVRDVEGFIRNEGQNYLIAGYWKVYHDIMRAQMLFHAYDQAKTTAVNEYLTGKSIQAIARQPFSL